MVLTTGLLGPRGSEQAVAMQDQAAAVMHMTSPAAEKAVAVVPPSAPDAPDCRQARRDSRSSSSSSCGSYSDCQDEDEPAARLTLRDDVLAQPADFSRPHSDWEASGEDGEGAESCADEEDEDVHAASARAPARGAALPAATKTTSRPSWVAAVFSRILRPFSWKSTPGLHLHSRPAEAAAQVPRRASFSVLPKVVQPAPGQPPPSAATVPVAAVPAGTKPWKKRDPALQGKKKRRRRRSVPPAPPASQTRTGGQPGRTVRGARGLAFRRKQHVEEESEAELAADDGGAASASDHSVLPADPGVEAQPGEAVGEAAPGARAAPVGARVRAKGMRLWRRMSTSLGRVSSQPVAMPGSDTASEATERTRSTASLGAEPKGGAAARPEDDHLPGVLEDHDDGLGPDTKALLIRTADSSMPGSLYHSTTASNTRLSSLAETGAPAEEGAEAEAADRPLSLCTANCRYDVVRRVAKRFGMKDVSEDEPWNLYWTDLSISLERCKDMKRFQKINHFPGMAEICRKDLLARNLNRMLRLFPKDYNFFPKTWCLPADLGDLNTYARTRRNRTYILKPDTGCQGKGIYLTRSVRDLKPHTRMICQVYIARPFLVDGFKFDMRVYTLVTSCDPLRVFVYNDGLVRFATSAYHEPNSHNTANVFMHLTNYAVNKHSRTFVVDEEAGSKRKISTLNRWLQSKNYDVVDIWARIDELIVKTLIAALPVIRHNYHACFPAHDFTYACFELLGFDVLLDHKLKPYVLEVNHSPSFHTDAQIDREVKETLLMDTFGILNMGQHDKRKVMEEDRRRVRDRLLQSIGHKDGSNASSTGSDGNLAPDSNPWKAQFEWEDSNMGNFRRVYPVADGQPDKYEAFFNQNQSSLFQETAASRAREEASRQQRDLHERPGRKEAVDDGVGAAEALEQPGQGTRQLHLCQVKQKEEEARRSMTLARRKEYERLRPESPNNAVPAGLAAAQLRKSRNARAKRGGAQAQAAARRLAAKCVLNSFLPEAISESEESVRAAALQERSQLVQNKGIVQLIYQMLKENKSLCAEDLRKYAAMNAEALPHATSTAGPAGPAGPPQRKDEDRLPSLLTLIQKTTGQGHAEASRGKGVLDPYVIL